MRLALLALLLLGSATLAHAVDFIELRGGLANSLAKFKASQETQAYTKVTYFGGSITAGAGSSKPEKSWRMLFHQHLRAQFPGATLAENNSALGGTGSWLGAFRTRNQALYGGAALVLVEFAVNDAGAAEEQTLASMEGIVRQIWRTDPTCDIAFVYTFGKNDLETYAKGDLPKAVRVHEKVAAHYGIPSVNVGAYAAAKINVGELKFEEFMKDAVHPLDRGYEIYTQALKEFLAQARAQNAQQARHTLPTPLSPAPMEKAQCVPYEWAKREGAWKIGQKSPNDAFMHILVGEEAGATMAFRFKGAQCGVFDLIGPDSGDLELSVDGGEWKKLSNWDQYAKSYMRAHSRPLAQGLDPQQWHDVKLRVATDIPAGSKGRTFRLGYLLVDGEVEDPLAKLDPLARLDAVWASVNQPLHVELQPDRLAPIPETMKRLRDGGTLKIVMLGDSIIGDTSSSKYELLLGRLYPKCKIEKITSVRGSTGCWWYKDDNRVQDYVLKHKPDLVMIGGISQRGDVEAIRSVIHQVRAAQPCEVMLMTPAFGAETDPHIAKWHYALDPDADDYRSHLQRLAVEEKCAFYDLTAPWWQFIKDSGCDYGYFRRDRVHANERGQAILGRLLEKYFAP